MKPPVLIGLAGRKQAGKNTTATIIRDLLPGKTVIERGFADLLKWSAYRIFKPDCTMQEAIEWCDTIKFPERRGVAGSILEHDAWSTVEFYAIGDREGEPTHDVNGREFLQRYGTEAHREIFGADFWVDALLPAGLMDIGRATEIDREIYGIEPTPQWVRNFDGADVALITDVRFPNEAQRVIDLLGDVWEIQRGDGDGGTHASEKPLPRSLVTNIIYNHGSLADLRAGIVSSLNDIGL